MSIHGIVCVLMAIGCVLYGSSGADAQTRNKREAAKCDDKYARIDGHTACMARSDDVTDAGVSEADKHTILDEHNKYRSQVNPPASNMLKLIWDDEVAMIAQKWVETCKSGHDAYRYIPGRFGVGQNAAGGYGSWAAAIKGWHSEVSLFTYNVTPSDWTKIAHYTQVVWAETATVGCGFAVCGTTKKYICNYAPGGNLGSKLSTPYTSSASGCEDCPGHCTDKLCDCGNKACENRVKMDLATCNCKSCPKHTFYVGDVCKLDCRNITEPDSCSKTTYATCNYFTKLSCPATCQICPWSGFAYVEGKSPLPGRNSDHSSAETTASSRYVVPLTILLAIAEMLYFF